MTRARPLAFAPLLLALLGGAGCSSRGRAQPAPPAPPAAAPGAAAPVAAAPERDTLVLRLVDALGTAEARTPDLRAAWGKLAWHWQKMPNPWATLKGDRIFAHAEVAFYRRDIKGYPGPAPRAAKGLATDKGWNKGVGVYDSRTAIFAPPPAEYGFRVTVPPAATLRFGHAWLAVPGQPAGAGLEFVAFARDANGATPLYARTLGGAEANEWVDVEVDLAPLAGREVTLVLATRSKGRPSGAGFFGDPLLFKRGGATGLNVVVVLLDTLRCEAVGACGGPFGLTPNLDAFARTGVTFRKAFANATWTRPSTIALLGGSYPSALSATAVRYTQRPDEPPKFYHTRPQLTTRLLRDRGYQVEFIGNNFFSLGYSPIGLDLGYERTVDIRHSVADTPAITRATEAWLEKNKDHQFFLMVHYDTPHIPWDPPPQYLAKVKPVPGRRVLPAERNYLGEIAYADDHVQRVFAALEKTGLRDRTLVIILGDHGETMSPAHAYRIVDQNLPTLFFHGWTAYDETTHVPLIFSLPGRVPAGRTSDQVVRLIDVAPTLLELLGVTPDRPMWGKSLARLLRGEPDPADRPVYIEGHGVHAYRDATHKYIRRDFGKTVVRNGATRSLPEELFDIRTDPGETRNLAPGAAAELRRIREAMRLEAEAAQRPPVAGPAPAGMPPSAAPAAPASGAAAYHLRLSADGRPHGLEQQRGSPAARLSGHIRAPGATVTLTGASGGGRAIPRADGLELDLTARDRLVGVDFEVDPPWTELELELTLDGQPLAKAALRLGRFGLSLADDPRRLGRGDLAFLDASSAPPMAAGQELGLYLWRAPVIGGEAAAAAAEGAGGSRGEVESLMKRWGYAQGDKKR
ncbi:MAG TPA: sulfatase [Polyangia bacterium]|jgi:arylsulfatase A-like enzyme